VYMGVPYTYGGPSGHPCVWRNWGPAGIWDPHIHMEAPYEKHYSYNASGPDPDATGIWDAHIHRDVPRGDPQVYGTPIYTWGPHMRSIIPTMLLDPPRREPWVLRAAAISLFPNFFVFKIVFRPATKDF
jgi:hypothetical protein